MRINLRGTQQLELNVKAIKKIEEFVYLGSTVSWSGETDEDTAQRVRKAKRVFAQLTPFCKYKKTIFQPVVIYGSETWMLTEADKERLCRFERKIIGKIYRGVEKNDEWRIRCNHVINDILENKDMVRNHQIAEDTMVLTFTAHRFPYAKDNPESRSLQLEKNEESQNALD